MSHISIRGVITATAHGGIDLEGTQALALLIGDRLEGCGICQAQLNSEGSMPHMALDGPVALVHHRGAPQRPECCR
jgi:hypothetical protein